MAVDIYGGLPKSVIKVKPKDNSVPKQPFRYLVVLDFEATCEQNTRISPQEIIEWPAMIIDTESIFILPHKFHYYVKPTHHPRLTPFCTKLTGITQQMIDKGHDIKSVITAWNQWCFDHELLPKSANSNAVDNLNFTPSACIVTCGDWDLKQMWSQQHQLTQCNAVLFHSWINLKVIFKNAISKSKGNAMMTMLKALNIPHTGRHHSGIDDVKNLCQIVLKMLKRGIVFDCTTKSFGKRSIWTDIQVKGALERKSKKRKIELIEDQKECSIKNTKKQKKRHKKERCKKETVVDLTADQDDEQKSAKK